MYLVPFHHCCATVYKKVPKGKDIMFKYYFGHPYVYYLNISLPLQGKGT